MITKTEKYIIKLFLEGLTPEEISKKMYVSINTTRTHITNILKKKNVNSITELIRTELLFKIKKLEEEQELNKYKEALNKLLDSYKILLESKE